MNSRSLHVMASLALIPLLTLSIAACGGDDKDETPAADSGVVDAGADTEQDTATPDVGKPDVGVKDAGPKDVSKPKKSCQEALGCLLQCSDAAGSCADNCQTDLGDGVDAKLKAIADCRAKECASASGDTAAVTCALAKCFADFDACMAYGKGGGECMATVVCIGGCALGDIGCTIDCLAIGAADKAAQASALKVCADNNCAAGDAVDMPGCVTTSCSSETTACAPKAPLDCALLSGCLAKCPPSKKTETNHCAGYCGTFADPAALALRGAYEECKEQCKLVTNPVGCVIDKCGAEQQACYTEVGAENCQNVYDCVVQNCSGIGGDGACITKCIKKGSASAQDAYLHWEGCILLNLEREEAETVGCEFPYDQTKCINYISGHFCGNLSAHCFTSN